MGDSAGEYRGGMAGDPVFLRTPQFVDGRLAARLGYELLLKIETLNPVKCFKGRGVS